MVIYLAKETFVRCMLTCRRLVQSRPELVDRYIAMNTPHSKLVNLPLHIHPYLNCVHLGCT